MLYRKYANGKLHLFNRKAIDSSKALYKIGDICYDVFGSYPIGRIDLFKVKNGYIYAVVNGVSYSLEQVYNDEI